MKKLICVFCILAVLLVSSACQADDPENLFSTSPENSTSTTEPESPTSTTESKKATTETDEPTAPTQEGLTIEPGYSYGNMHKGVPSGNFMRYGDTILFSVVDVLYSYDINSGEVTLFCKDATCDHTTSDCAANGVCANLEQYNGNLYGEGFPGPVMELKNERFDPITKGEVSHFWHSGGNLYAATMDSSLIVYENGSTEPRVLLDEYTGYWETVFDEYLYYSSMSNVIRINLREENPQPEVVVENAIHLTDGEYIYYTTVDENQFYRCKMDGSDPELLFDKPLLASCMNFDEEFFYFVLYTEFSNCKREDGADVIEIYRFPKNDPTKIEKISELDATDGCVYTVPGWDEIFVVAMIRTENIDGEIEVERFIYTMNKDGSNPQRLELPEF